MRENKDESQKEAEFDKLLMNGATKIMVCLRRDNLKRIPITFIGHSLGGLFIRNCIGWLYEYGYFSRINWKDENLSEQIKLLNEDMEINRGRVVSSCQLYLNLYTSLRITTTRWYCH